MYGWICEMFRWGHEFVEHRWVSSTGAYEPACVQNLYWVICYWPLWSLLLSTVCCFLLFFSWLEEKPIHFLILFSHSRLIPWFKRSLSQIFHWQEEALRNWTEIFTQQYHYERLEAEAEELRGITQSDACSWLLRHTHPGDGYRKLSVKVCTCT